MNEQSLALQLVIALNWWRRVLLLLLLLLLFLLLIQRVITVLFLFSDSWHHMILPVSRDILIDWPSGLLFIPCERISPSLLFLLLFVLTFRLIDNSSCVIYRWRLLPLALLLLNHLLLRGVSTVLLLLVDHLNVAVVVMVLQFLLSFEHLSLLTHHLLLRYQLLTNFLVRLAWSMQLSLVVLTDRVGLLDLHRLLFLNFVSRFNFSTHCLEFLLFPFLHRMFLFHLPTAIFLAPLLEQSLQVFQPIRVYSYSHISILYKNARKVAEFESESEEFISLDCGSLTDRLIEDSSKFCMSSCRPSWFLISSSCFARFAELTKFFSWTSLLV